MGVNSAKVIGYLGSDPEIHNFQDGGKVANFSVATTEHWNDKTTGEKKESTEWHRIVLRGGGASIAERFLKKGSHLYVEGKLRTRNYEKAGVTHYVTEILATTIEMLDSASQGQPKSDGYAPDTAQSSPPAQKQPATHQATNTTPPQTGAATNKPFTGEVSEDIPF